MFKKRSIFFYGLAILIPSVVLLIYSCSVASNNSSSSSTKISDNSSSSIPTTQNNLKLKLYMGSASVGDFISYVIDNSNNQLIYSNMTRGYSWSANFTVQPDGSRMFNLPNGFGNSTAAYFIEIPDKVLAVTFQIGTGSGGGAPYKPALAILTPNTITNSAGLTNMNGMYFQLLASKVTNSSNPWEIGLYSINQMGVYITNASVTVFQSNPSNQHISPNGFTGTVIYSNNTTYGPSPGENGVGTNYIPASANGYTYVADLGQDAGFSFGCLLRQTQIQPADYAGKYILMYLDQSRNRNETVLTQDNVVRGYAILSNNGPNVDIYTSTNDADYNYVTTMLADSAIIDYPLNSVVYFARPTNSGGGGALVPSADLSMALLGFGHGSSYDTNNDFQAMFGFAMKITN